MARQKSISSRLFLWLLCAGLLAVTIGGSTLYLEVRSIILASVDHVLWSDVEIFTGLLHVEDGELEFEYAESTSGQYAIPRSGHYYQIVVDDELLDYSISLAGETLELLPEQLAYADLSRNLKVYTALGPAGEPLRTMERSVIFAGHPIRVIIGHSLVENYVMLDNLRIFLLLSGAFGLLLIALTGWQISRKALQPLNDFSTRIHSISEKNLDQRLETKIPYREFVPLTNAFNSLLERLQRSLQLREELLSEVSHQLKTPVAVIRSHCDIYLQRERPTTEYIEALEIIRTTSDRMGQTLRRLLSIAQSEAELIGAHSFPVIDLRGCLDKARLTVEPLAQERQIEIISQVEAGLQIRGHQERLVEAFANLLENALKYNRPQGEVRIWAQQQGELVEVRIEDSGCGIDPEEVEKIFQRFYRGRGAEESEGSGLGLVLVKTIIEAHQGKIDVSSSKQGGSCFCVTLSQVKRQVSQNL